MINIFKDQYIELFKKELVKKGLVQDLIRHKWICKKLT